MEFGVQFFPSVGPDKKSAEKYWGEALQLTQRAEQLGYANVRTVEHYFHPYGGYSPDPLIFLSAAAAMTRTIRTHHRRRSSGIQQSAEARWPDRHGGRDL